MLNALRSGLLLVASLATAPTGGAQAQGAAGGCDLCSPAYRGDIPRVEQLLDQGAKTAPPAGLIAPLGWALANEHLDVALLLLKRGADPNVAIPGNGGISPLDIAVEKQDVALVSALIAAGADINDGLQSGPSGSNGEGIIAGATPLYLACSAPLLSAASLKIIDLLLAAGANPRSVAAAGNGTPLEYLLYAAANQPDAIAVVPQIKALLASGAIADDPAAMESALGFAKIKHDPSLIALLLTYGARVDPKESAALFEAVRGHPELMPGLVDAGAVIDQESGKNDSVLNLALRADDTAAAKEILALGADPNLEGGLGRPFSQLIRVPNPEMVQAVMGAGADLGALFYEPKGEIGAAPQNDAELNKAMFPAFSADSQGLLDRIVRERYFVLSGMSKYFYPPHNIADLEVSFYPQDPHPPPALAKPAPGSIPLSEYEGWLLAASDYVAAPNAQAAFFAASKGLAELPSIPDAARQHEAAGRALYAKASTPTGALAAAAEYEAAVRLAPWVGAYHRNLCVLYDLGGALLRAYEHCVIYESGAPADLVQIKQRSDAILDRLKSVGMVSDE